MLLTDYPELPRHLRLRDLDLRPFAPGALVRVGSGFHRVVEPAVRAQLRGWWGAQVDAWQHLRTDAIAHGQTDQAPPFHPKQPVSLGQGLGVCGDHRDTASIEGAMYSGRRCAEALLGSG